MHICFQFLYFQDYDDDDDFKQESLMSFRSQASILEQKKKSAPTKKPTAQRKKLSLKTKKTEPAKKPKGKKAAGVKKVILTYDFYLHSCITINFFINTKKT